jgi:hypothetical protein
MTNPISPKVVYGLFLRFLHILVPPALRVNDATFVQAAACSLTPFVAYILSNIVFYPFPNYQAPIWMLLAYCTVPIAIWIFKRHEPPAIIFLAVQFVSSMYLVYVRVSPKYAFLSSAVSAPMVRVPHVRMRFHSDLLRPVPRWRRFFWAEKVAS